MPETILVTGATGTIGRRLVKQLLANKGEHRILAAVRNREKALDLESTGAELVDFDWTKTGTVEQAFAGVTKLFLLTGSIATTSQESAAAVSAAEAAGVGQIVKLSVMGAESEPGITLTRLHRSAELAIMGSQIDWVFLRPNSFMQNFSTQAESIKFHNMFFLPLASASVSYVDADDVAAVASTILLGDAKEYSGKALTITGPAALSGEETAAAFSKALEREIKYQRISDDDFRRSMSFNEMPNDLTESLVELFREEREGHFAEIASAVPSITGRAALTFEEYVAANRALYTE